MKRALLIAGPTASGKSAMALDVAAQRNGIIINTDSMQVYRELRILTARPNEEEEAQAPHRLYGMMNGAHACSAKEWATLAENEIKIAWEHGQFPILVGGTGMYFKTLLEGMAEIPEINPNIRADVRLRAKVEGAEALHAELSKVDPSIADRLEPADSQRISRALEVFLSTGKPLSEWHKDTRPGFLDQYDQVGEVDKIVLDWPRDVLYERCDKRFDMMIDQGALEEVEKLMAMQLDPTLPIMKSLGVPSLISYLQGNMSIDAALEEAKMLTRRFAKRQLTWFRNQFSDWKRHTTQ
jgi:tRNA dimethylallyltransferase